MTQGELEQIPQPFVELMSELEMRIMKDIIERIKVNGSCLPLPTGRSPDCSN